MEYICKRLVIYNINVGVNIMDGALTIYPVELITVTISICAGFTTMAGAAIIVFNIIKKMREPEERQNDRINKLEDRADDLENVLNKYKKRIDKIEFGNTVVQESILALLEHALNANDVAPVKEAKKKLENYLLNSSSIA